MRRPAWCVGAEVEDANVYYSCVECAHVICENEKPICVQCNVNVCKRSYYVGLLNGNREG